MSELPLRKFGLMFAVVFVVLAAWHRANAWAAVALAALSLLTLAGTFLRPALLAGPARAWMRLAELLHRVVSPVVLGAMYLILFVPFGLARRWLGKDPLTRRFEPRLPTYWIAREPRTRSLEDFRQQF